MTEATAEETTGAQTTEKPEDESETEAAETTVKKDDSVPTDEKKGLPIDFCVVEGLEFGMTTDEVKAVMGEPDSTSEYEGLLVYKYGKSEIRFGDVSGSVNEVVADHKSDLKKETTEDSGERLMTMINIYDDSLDSHLYGGITFGSDAGKIKEKYYHEEIKDLPADLQKEPVQEHRQHDRLAHRHQPGQLREQPFAYRQRLRGIAVSVHPGEQRQDHHIKQMQRDPRRQPQNVQTVIDLPALLPDDIPLG